LSNGENNDDEDDDGDVDDEDEDDEEEEEGDEDEEGSGEGGGEGEQRGGNWDLPPPPAVFPDGGPMRRVRESLPVFAHRHALLAAFRDSPSGACVIEGETGSGKTTQVAQYILEDARARGAGVKIICTQPRRISAISVAERVAAERGEKVGGTVGYAIRGETKAGAETQLLFCTTGVLLRRLESDPTLAGTTHVLVDEVHERTLESDFLLMALRKLLLKQQQQQQQQQPASSSASRSSSQSSSGSSSRRSSSSRRLAIGLMSATMPGDLMTSYLGGPAQCPRVSFPGRAFPVTSLFLEEALALVPHYRVEPHADWCRYSTTAMRRQKQRQASMGDKGGTAGSGSSSLSPDPPLMFGASAAENARRFPRASSSVHAALASLDEDAVNVQLIVELCQWYTRQGGVGPALRTCDRARLGHGGGARGDADDDDDDDTDSGSNGALAVLVFLPGTREIQDVQDALLRTAEFGALAEQRAWVLPLHGGLPPDEQRRVFDRPPTRPTSGSSSSSSSSSAGGKVVKVILATNVAETSVTIDDVGFVIDAGRVKEERYYPVRMGASTSSRTEHSDVALSNFSYRMTCVPHGCACIPLILCVLPSIQIGLTVNPLV
jgi:HrpA-like RNA helicase